MRKIEDILTMVVAITVALFVGSIVIDASLTWAEPIIEALR